jgi:large subunit ribosomal protein L24
MKVRKGDKVLIIKGKDRKKTGSVLGVLLKKEKVTIDGLNMIMRHSKPKRSGEKGQKIKRPAPVAISNIKLICPKCKNPTKIGYQISDSNKVRFCKKCKSSID